MLCACKVYGPDSVFSVQGKKGKAKKTNCVGWFLRRAEQLHADMQALMAKDEDQYALFISNSIHIIYNGVDHYTGMPLKPGTLTTFDFISALFTFLSRLNAGAPLAPQKKVTSP